MGDTARLLPWLPPAPLGCTSCGCVAGSVGLAAALSLAFSSQPSAAAAYRAAVCADRLRGRLPLPMLSLPRLPLPRLEVLRPLPVGCNAALAPPAAAVVLLPRAAVACCRCAAGVAAPPPPPCCARRRFRACSAARAFLISGFSTPTASAASIAACSFCALSPARASRSVVVAALRWSTAEEAAGAAGVRPRVGVSARTRRPRWE